MWEWYLISITFSGHCGDVLLFEPATKGSIFNYYLHCKPVAKGVCPWIFYYVSVTFDERKLYSFNQKMFDSAGD